jgi:hypothetical protein
MDTVLEVNPISQKTKSMTTTHKNVARIETKSA